MPARYHKVVSPRIHAKIHFWRKVRDVASAISCLTIPAALFDWGLFLTLNSSWSLLEVRVLSWTVAICVFVVACWCQLRVIRYWQSRTELICSCGYNLNGNMSGRCPECGSPVPGEISEYSHAR